MVYPHHALSLAGANCWSVWGSRAMGSRLILKSGQRGTKKPCTEQQGRLLYVRYRYDEERRKRFKTVELVVDEVDWESQDREMRGDTVVGLRVTEEMELRHTVKPRAAGGIRRDGCGSCGTTGWWDSDWRVQSSGI